MLCMFNPSLEHGLTLVFLHGGIVLSPSLSPLQYCISCGLSHRKNTFGYWSVRSRIYSFHKNIDILNMFLKKETAHASWAFLPGLSKNTPSVLCYTRYMLRFYFSHYAMRPHRHPTIKQADCFHSCSGNLPLCSEDHTGGSRAALHKSLQGVAHSNLVNCAVCWVCRLIHKADN